MRAIRSLPANTFSVVLEEALLLLILKSYRSEISPLEMADLRRGLAVLAEFANAAARVRQRPASRSGQGLEDSSESPGAGGHHVGDRQGPTLAHVAAVACLRRMEVRLQRERVMKYGETSRSAVPPCSVLIGHDQPNSGCGSAFRFGRRRF